MAVRDVLVVLEDVEVKVVRLGLYTCAGRGQIIPNKVPAGISLRCCRFLRARL